MENPNTPVPQTTPEYAGFWLRVVAYLIDGLILSAAQGILFIPVYFAIGLSTFIAVEGGCNEPDPAILLGLIPMILIISLISMALNWLYFALMESSKYRATLGKLALGLAVTTMEGEKISFGQATGRYFGKILSGLILYIGFFMAGFTDKKQALHDMLANTLVIRKR